MPVFASEEEVKAEASVEETAAAEKTKSAKAYAAAIVVGLAAAAGAVAMGMAITKSVDGIARQPEAEGKIRTTLMLGLVFVETAIIYALVVGILIIFVL
ncbi:MAG: ATP synthase F0 subunit C [Ruminococcaceae bacterium]|nr:ATP synthase F0 subunit C [Oscillospiraceae bacterium]